MGFKPALNERQWNRIAELLPETRRDRVVIEAILFRAHSGRSLAEVSETFEVKRSTLHLWQVAIATKLPAIMAALKLEPASPLARSRGGSRHHHSTEMQATIAAIRMQGFRDALRGR
jgi:hypothetical protein